MKKAIAWFEFIPCLFSDSYVLSEHGVYINETEKEILDDLKEGLAIMQQQVWDGERDAEDVELDIMPVEVMLFDDGRISEVSHNGKDINLFDITDKVHEVLRTNNITDSTKFNEEIKEYVNKHHKD